MWTNDKYYLLSVLIAVCGTMKETSLDQTHWDDTFEKIEYVFVSCSHEEPATWNVCLVTSLDQTH
jgi:hypothetical protein